VLREVGTVHLDSGTRPYETARTERYVVSAKETNLEGMLAGKRQYQVPLYQRVYSWGQRQLDQLCRDILQLATDRTRNPSTTHFVGSLVLASSPDAGPVGVQRYLVVDGQQRLTTLTILLAALRDHRPRATEVMSPGRVSLSGVSSLRSALSARRLADDNNAWSLLRATNAPVVIAVLGAHLAGEFRRRPAPVLHEAIESDLEDLRAHGFNLPRTAVQYCGDWLADGYLVRRPGESREEYYELSEGAHVAIRFVEQLADPRPSVTESRLATIVERVHRLAVDTDPDVTRRIAALEAERDRIDAQIAALASGEVIELPADRAVERVVDILSLAAEIPEDFARVRASLEQLNRDVRRQLVEEPESRGAVLDDVFRGVDLLADSDAGRSFAGFYSLVLDAERAATFEDEVDALVQRSFARSLTREQVRAFSRMLPALQDAGTEIHLVMTSFSRSLRRFVQSEELAEDRRVHRLVREALADANALTGQVAPFRQTGLVLSLTAVSPSQVSAMRLHNPADGETTEDVRTARQVLADVGALRELVRASEIDLAELTANVNAVLVERGPSTIAEILAERPATQGVASVVGLLVLAEDFATRTSQGRAEHVTWATDQLGSAPEPVRGAVIPTYLFEEAIA
jgi:hypothetical protein